MSVAVHATGADNMVSGDDKQWAYLHRHGLKKAVIRLVTCSMDIMERELVLQFNFGREIKVVRKKLKIVLATPSAGLLESS